MKDGRAVYDIRKKHAVLEPERFPLRVELSRKRAYLFPARKIVRYFIYSLASVSFLFGLAQAPIDRSGTLFAASTNETERAQLEAQLRELEKEIADNEATIAQYQKQGKTLQSEINTLNSKIAKINLQIRAITLTLQKLNTDISDTKNKITHTEGEISDYKDYLSTMLQTIYENDNKNMVELVMANPKFSDFFLDVNNLLAIQDNLRQTLEKVVALKNDLMDQKESLAMQYEDAQQLKDFQVAQQASAKKTESEKKDLLKATKGQESKYQAIVADKRKTAAQIRSRLYELLGGGEISFGEAYRMAKIAGDATGVRPALILAVLDRESALGRNVGKCKYDVNPYYPAQASNPTTMAPGSPWSRRDDVTPFLQITKSLGLDPHNVYVSCPIPSDGAFGGAMGPAQFIPTTWMTYADDISAITGNRPANPWNNLDAFVATSLYMRNAGAVSGNLSSERIAAAKYYCGSNWNRYTCTNVYGKAVIERAEDFQADIDVLNS